MFKSDFFFNPLDYPLFEPILFHYCDDSDQYWDLILYNNNLFSLEYIYRNV